MLQPSPTGTVALVFTDVEGSSVLWERLDAAFKPCLDVHDGVLRGCIAAHGGYEVKTEGDAFMVAFWSAADALAFCVSAQEGLAGVAWPTELAEGIRVRMGVHVGAPICTQDPLTGRGDYYGPVVNRAARVGSAAHGGQVLASAAAAACAPPHFGVEDIGEYALSGLAAPERLHQITGPELLARPFPPPRARAVRRTNVAAPASPIFGRAAELGALAEAVRVPGVTALYGLPGIGKTRMLEELVLRTAASGTDAWLVDLHGCIDEAEACARIAVALGLPGADSAALASLGHAIAARGPTLLVLDSVGAALASVRAAVAAWCAEAPALHLVFVGRSRVGMHGASQVEVGPLAIADARALFLSVARAAVPGFVAPVADVDALVRALDALPLALVLAAPRVRMVRVDELRRRLDARFSMLRRQDATGSVSLAAALDEAWAPLTPEERAAVVALTVFEGTFPLEWAESLLAAGDPASDPFDVLQRLIDHGIVRREHGRLVLPALVRTYARSHGAPSEAAHGVHLALCAALATPAMCESIRSKGLGSVSADVVEALGNFRVAVERAERWSPAVLACASAASQILRLRGPLDAAVDVLVRASELPGAPDAVAAGALADAAHLCIGAGRPDRVAAMLATAERCAVAAADASLIVAIAGFRGVLAVQQGRDAEAEPLLRAALVGAESRQEHRLASLWSASLGHICSHRGDLSGAAERFSAALAHARVAGDLRLQAEWIGNSGYVHQNAKDHAAARRAYEQALALAREVGDRRAEGLWLGNLGDVLRELRSFPSAATMTAEALAVAQEVGDRKREGVWLGNLGDIQLALGDAAGEPSLRAAVDILDRAWPLAGGVFRRHLAEALHARGARAEARMVIDQAAAALRGVHSVEFVRLAALAARVLRADGDTAGATAWLEEAESTCRTLDARASGELLAEIAAARVA